MTTNNIKLKTVRNGYLALLFIIFLFALAPSKAQAQWGGWESLGGIILEAPNCVSWQPVEEAAAQLKGSGSMLAAMAAV
jgi:hypothetical protein